MRIKCRCFFAILLVCCFLTVHMAAGDTDVGAAIDETDVSIANIEINQIDELNPGTEASKSVSPQFQIDAKSAILIEAETGNVLYAFNENEPLPIASITKIMTMLLVMEAVDAGKCKFSDTTAISAYATQMGG